MSAGEGKSDNSIDSEWERPSQLLPGIRATPYEHNDQVTKSDNADTPSTPHIILNFGYDANGNNTSVTNNAGVRVQSAYDSRDLLVNRTWSGGGIEPASYSQHFDAAWQLVEQDRFGDTTGTNLIAKSLFTYDPVGRVQTISHQDALGHVLANYQYTYDAAGQLTQEIHHGIAFNYGYDKDGQLTTTTRSDQPAPAVQSFDANGNRTDSSVVVGPDNRVLSDADFTYPFGGDTCRARSDLGGDDLFRWPDEGEGTLGGEGDSPDQAPLAGGTPGSSAGSGGGRQRSGNQARNTSGDGCGSWARRCKRSCR